MFYAKTFAQCIFPPKHRCIPFGCGYVVPAVYYESRLTEGKVMLTKRAFLIQSIWKSASITVSPLHVAEHIVSGTRTATGAVYCLLHSLSG